jgi:carboxyl-terminal processing protease
MRKVMLAIAAILTILVITSCSVAIGFYAGRNFDQALGIPQINSTPPAAALESESPATDTGFTPFWEAWDIVHKYYVDQPVDDTLLIQGAIRGMIDALGDQHSSYQDPKQYEDFNLDISGEYEGIGAYVNTEGEYLTITDPMPDSPAEKAGLLPGDEIIAIDGEDMTGTLPEVARQKVLGPKGSLVKLTIRREGLEEPFVVEIQRASIKVPSITGEMLDGNIAYIKIASFSDQTDEDLHTLLEELIAQEPEGLIIDLRNNGGGLLRTAIAIGSEFLKDGVILYEEYGDGSRDTHPVIEGGLATEIPLVILVNEFSASASEVVAGAVQDTGRGILIGETTFGKGSVQNIIPLSNEQGAVRVTIARWLTPKERQINEIGLTPDIAVEMTDEDHINGLDPQLDAALDYFKK